MRSCPAALADRAASAVKGRPGLEGRSFGGREALVQIRKSDAAVEAWPQAGLGWRRPILQAAHVPPSRRRATPGLSRRQRGHARPWRSMRSSSLSATHATASSGPSAHGPPMPASSPMSRSMRAGHVFVMLRQDPLVQPADPRVVELSPEGDYLGGWGGELIADSHMMTVDAKGRMLAVDRDMHEVIICSTDGRAAGRARPPRRAARALQPPDRRASLGLGRHLCGRWLCARAGSTASPAMASLIGGWGSHGQDDGQFGWPHALWTFADGRVVVVDRSLNRVQVFDRDGRHLAELGRFLPAGRDLGRRAGQRLCHGHDAEPAEDRPQGRETRALPADAERRAWAVWHADGRYSAGGRQSEPDHAAGD